MRIYISVDMEGISGINTMDYVFPGSDLYQEGRKLMTEDTNAAIRGAFAGGADEVIVMDGHNVSNNLITELLDERALILTGTPHAPLWPFLKGSDGMFMVGYHAMAGVERANQEHTMTSHGWFRYAVNGRPYGELGIHADTAGWEGVPVVMVSGDDKLCDEAREFLGDQVETACVKQGVGRHCALCLSPAEGRRRIEKHAERAVRRLVSGEKFPLFLAGSPVTEAITYKFTPDADAAMKDPRARRVDGYTVERVFNRLIDVNGGLWSEEGEAQKVHFGQDEFERE